MASLNQRYTNAFELLSETGSYFLKKNFRNWGKNAIFAD